MNARANLLELLDEAEAIAATYKARSIDSIRADYKRTIGGAMNDYLTSRDRATTYKSIYKKAATEVIPEAFYAGYEQAGGDPADVDRDADDWLTGRMNQEIGFIDELFVALKQMRDQFWGGELTASDLRDEVANRSEGYTATIDAVYIAGQMWGNKNQMLWWRLGPTEKHCQNKNGKHGCLELNGQHHKASWYLARNLIPRYPGSGTTCGGYECQCRFEDAQGNEITL